MFDIFIFVNICGIILSVRMMRTSLVIVIESGIQPLAFRRWLLANVSPSANNLNNVSISEYFRLMAHG